jgi:hypothetical protein
VYARALSTILLFLPCRNNSSGPRTPHYRGFRITRRHTTLGRAHLDKCSSTRRDLYLTTHNSHKRSMPPTGLDPTIPGSERSQNNDSDRAATEIVILLITKAKRLIKLPQFIFSSLINLMFYKLYHEVFHIVHSRKYLWLLTGLEWNSNPVSKHQT